MPRGSHIFLTHTDDASFSVLYNQSNVESQIRRFIMEKKQASGAVISFGTLKHQEILVVGNQQEINDYGKAEIIPMKSDSIFDLASVTKLFTCIVILKLIDEKILTLSDKIYDLDNRFINLREVMVEDLLSFRVVLRTNGRIDTANNIEEVNQLMYKIEQDITATRQYSDMGAMVLKMVAEHVTHENFFELVKKYILLPCDMVDTDIQIEKDNIYRTVSNNFERRIVKDSEIVISDISLGIVNDGKARRINQFGHQLFGHAGLFSTSGDMIKLSQKFLNGDLLSERWIQEIGVNRTGDDVNKKQFHGYMCYVKNPARIQSEVNHYLSGDAFSLGGYTGNLYTLDYRNGLFLFMASNRCHNRITSVIDSTMKYTDKIKWSDGNSYICNQRYAYDRDEYLIEPVIKLALQYRYLEYLMEQDGIELETTRCERFIK